MARYRSRPLRGYRARQPLEGVAQELTDRCRQVAKMLAHNVRESRTLAALRDALLPKLLGGEIRLPAACACALHADRTIAAQAGVKVAEKQVDQ